MRGDTSGLPVCEVFEYNSTSGVAVEGWVAVLAAERRGGGGEGATVGLEEEGFVKVAALEGTDVESMVTEVRALAGSVDDDESLLGFLGTAGTALRVTAEVSGAERMEEMERDRGIDTGSEFCGP